MSLRGRTIGSSSSRGPTARGGHEGEGAASDELGGGSSRQPRVRIGSERCPDCIGPLSGMDRNRCPDWVGILNAMLTHGLLWAPPSHKEAAAVGDTDLQPRKARSEDPEVRIRVVRSGDWGYLARYLTRPSSMSLVPPWRNRGASSPS